MTAVVTTEDARTALVALADELDAVENEVRNG